MKFILSYLDPGSLSIIWQALAAGLLALAAGVSFFWKSISNFFRKIFSKKKKNK